MRKLMSLMLMSLLTISVIDAQDASDRIRLNQLGFYPGARKIAIVENSGEAGFVVKSVPSGEVVLKSNLGSPVQSRFSSKTTRMIDFSKVTKPGTYKITVEGLGDSFTFSIQPDVMNGLSKALIKGFYFQRMSTTLTPQYAGKWSRAAGHPDTEVLVHPAAASEGRPANTVISCPKGWYDAGDYNKYVVNSGITMGTLLSAYEDFPSYFDTLNLNIPESGDNVPDILNEILWNLRWMFTMQDPFDGGVYNKVTNANFDPFIMPEKCVTPRYVVPKGTAATLDFAAVMAQSGRIFSNFKKQLPGLSDSCMKASTRAWDWAMKNPKLAYNQNQMNKDFKPVVTTGGYGDSNFSDEFIWAASELYLSTKNNSYYTAVTILPDTLMPLPSWGNVRLLGYYSLARFNGKLTGEAKKDFPVIKARIIRAADAYSSATAASAYNVVMGRTARDFEWGSNAVAANQGILLLQAYKLAGNRKYLEDAMGNLDYLTGRNATGYSFITGFGKKTTMFPHHRLSEADGVADPIPGLLAGGPNPGQQDKCTTYPSKVPDESYTDAMCSYASNEIAINWNAPAAYLAGAIEAINHKKQ
jgi:endoglucanase